MNQPDSELITTLNEESEKIHNENIEEDNINDSNFILNTEIMMTDNNNEDVNAYYYKDFEVINEEQNMEITHENNKEARYVELFEDNSIEEEIPILDDLSIGNKINDIKDIENKDKKINCLINQAYDLIPKECFDDLMKTYKECQDNLSNSLTKQLDSRILSYCQYDQDKYGSFLEVFYKIIYLKFLQQVNEQK